MIYIPADIEIDDENILAQIEHTKEALWQFENQLHDLHSVLINGAAVKDKGVSKETPQMTEKEN